MSPDSADIDPEIQKGRSRVSNGSSLFLIEHDGKPIDGRTTVARRFRDILSDIISDLGGRDEISEAEYQLARRAAGLSVQAEVIEAFLAGQEFSRVSVEDYCRLVSSLNRTLSNIGLRRRARDITPSLEDIREGRV